MSFGAATTGGGFGAPATGAAGGFGFGQSAATPGGFGFGQTGGATGGGFGGGFAPTTGAAFGQASGGAFGAATGSGFGAAGGTFGATGGAFGGVGGFGQSTAGGAFGAGFGASTGAFGAASGGAFGAQAPGFGAGASGFGGSAPAAGFGAPAQLAPAQDWAPIQWRMKFEKLPELLQAKMNQHYNMVEDCKERNKEIRKIFDRRRENVSLATSVPTDADGRAGGRGFEEEVEDVKTERMASRLRHCLASLKTSLQHDSWELQRQHDQAVREKQVSYTDAFASLSSSQYHGTLFSHQLPTAFAVSLLAIFISLACVCLLCSFG